MMDFDQEYLRSKIMKSGDEPLDMKLDDDGVMRYYMPQAEEQLATQSPAMKEEPMLPPVTVIADRDTTALPKPKIKPKPAMPTQGQLDLGEAKPIEPAGTMGVLKKVGEIIQSGAEKIDFDVLGLPGIGTLTLKDLTVGDLGKVLVDIAEGFPPITGKGETLKPTMEALELINVAPAASVAYKAGKKVVSKAAKELAPAAGEMFENYLTKTGMLLKATPDSAGIEIQSAPRLDTPAFKNWFGNSKVVDDKGQPLVVYHGSATGKIESFKTEGPGRFYGPGAYFAFDAEDAAVYAQNAERRNRGISQTIYPVYLSIKNPMPIDVAMQRKMLDKMVEQRMRGGDWVKAILPELKIKMIEAKYDGFILKDESGKLISAVVFNPKQIKSVFNKGTFNPKDPRILYGGGTAGAGTAMTGEEKK